MNYPNEAQMTNKEALNRFCKNLVADAKSGKLDPVIGRDDEIRRVLQILRAAQRTTLSSLANPARVRRPLPRVWHSVS